MITKNLTLGLIESPPKPHELKDNTLSSNSKPFSSSPLPDYRPYLTRFESQIGSYGDTDSCVSFAALNNLEVCLKMRYSLELNMSDRFTAVMSGTIPNVGNTFTNVTESIINDGFVFEDFYPWDRWSKEDYHQPIPNHYGKYQPPQCSLKKRALLQKQDFHITKRWVGWGGVEKEQLKQALKFGPMMITIFAGFPPDEHGVYHYETTYNNHAVLLVHIDEDGTLYCFDHYASKKIRRVGSDSYIGAALQLDITINKDVSALGFSSIFKAKHGRLPTVAEHQSWIQAGSDFAQL